jgi:hypothetical protein
MPWTQTDTSFKKLQNKRITTSSGKGIDEEKGASALELYLPDVKTELIPGTPPGASTSVLAYTGAIGQTLVVDTSVPGNLTWFATTGYGNTTAANDGSFLSESQRLGDWISDKYDGFGTVSGAGYEIKVYDVNSNLITKADPSDWLFDYQTGILVFNNASTTYGAVSSTGPFRVVGYRYIGKKGIIPADYGGLGYTTYNLGDLFVGAGSTIIKFPIGSNNQVLKIDTTSSTGLTWGTAASSAITTLNGLTDSTQTFATGTSGTFFNISSVGSSHTFNIPIAGTGSTGLITTLAQSFAGVKTFTNDTIISSSTATLSSSSGALTVTGGVGIGGSLFVSSASNISGIVVNNGIITNASWSGNLITALYGGTGYNSYTKGDILVGSGNTFIKLGVGTDNYVLTASSASATGLSWLPTAATGITTLNGLTATNQTFEIGYSGAFPAFSSSTSTHTLNIPLAGSASTGLVSTASQTFAGSKTFSSNVIISDSTASTAFNSGALVVTGGVGIGGSVNIQGDLTVNGTFTTINSTTVTVADKNLELGVVSVPTDLTAQAGGITLKGATDKSIIWYSGVGWSSSESWNLGASNTYKIGNTTVLSTTSLGIGVTNSSLTAVGTISTGVWAGTLITALYGGTGYSSYTKGDVLVGAGNTFIKLGVGTDNYVLTASSSSSTGLTWSPTAAVGITTLNGIDVGTQTLATGTAGAFFNISSVGSSHTFNIPIAGTGATGLVTTLAQSFAGTKTFTGDVVVSSTTGSTAFNTGSLTVYGGLGVSGQLSFNQAALGYTGASNPSMAFIGSTNSPPITLTVLSDNSLLFEGTSGKLFGINNNLSTGWIFNVGDISGLPIIRANADGTIAMAEFTANVGIGLSNPSYKLHVVGDTNLSSGSVYRINGTPVLSSTSLGTGVTNSSLTALGTITTGVWAGTSITNYYGGTGYQTYSTGDILVGAGTTLIKLPVGTNNYVLTADSTVAGGVKWTSTAATGVTTLNGLNVGLQYFETGTSGNFFNISSSGSTHTFNIPIASTGSTGLVTTLAQSFAGAKTFTNDTVISSSTVSTSTSTGALTVTGGVGIGGSLYTDTSTADSISGVVLNNGLVTSGTWAATAITTRYGGTGYTAYTLGDLLVGAGSTFIKLPVGINSYVLGADSSKPSGVGWTTVTPLTVSDTAPSSPKNADLWFNSTDGGLLVYYNDVNTAQWVEIALGSGIDLSQPLHITNTTPATSTSTGALIVDGGAGIAGSVFASSFTVNNINDFVSTSLVTSTTTADQVALIIDANSYRSAKIYVQMNSSSSYHALEIMMVHDGSDIYMTEYGSVNNGSILSTFDGDINSGNMRLLVTPTNAITTYKISCNVMRI